MRCARISFSVLACFALSSLCPRHCAWSDAVRLDRVPATMRHMSSSGCLSFSDSSPGTDLILPPTLTAPAQLDEATSTAWECFQSNGTVVCSIRVVERLLLLPRNRRCHRHCLLRTLLRPSLRCPCSPLSVPTKNCFRLPSPPSRKPLPFACHSVTFPTTSLLFSRHCSYFIFLLLMSPNSRLSPPIMDCVSLLPMLAFVSTRLAGLLCTVCFNATCGCLASRLH